MEITVVVVGDEILAGHVQDANAYFIAQRANALGHHVGRIVVVADSPDDVANEVMRALDGSSELVLVCGGIGPTHDDRTMEGVARALDVPLVPSPVLSRWIDVIVERVGDSVSAESWGTGALRKMELVPTGAEVFASSLGYIPVVTVATPSARVVILPGPPRELQAVFTEHVETRYLAGTGVESACEEIVHPFFESTLAETLTALQASFPSTSIGSYPQADHTLVRIAGPPGEVADAGAALRAHLDGFTRSEEGQRLLRFIGERRARRDAAQAP